MKTVVACNVCIKDIAGETPSTAPDETQNAPQGGRVYRSLMTAAGTLCLITGALGVILPLLPTTPFLLISIYCYSKAGKDISALRRFHKKHLAARPWR